MGKSRDPDITSIGATVDKLGVDEGGPLGGVERLVDLLAPGRLPEREPDYVVHRKDGRSTYRAISSGGVAINKFSLCTSKHCKWFSTNNYCGNSLKGDRLCT